MTTAQWLAHYWGWIVFWCIILGVQGSIVSFSRRALRTRHERRLELIKARRKRDHHGYRRPVPAGAPAVTTCAHLKVVPVRTGGGDLVGWLCANPVCGKQFPPDSQVLAEEDVAPDE